MPETKQTVPNQDEKTQAAAIAGVSKASASEGVSGKSRPAKGERLQNLKERGQRPKAVRGHVMPIAEIFKFGSLIVVVLLVILVGVLVWPYVSELFEPGGVDRVTEQVRDAGPGGFLIILAIQFLQIVVAFIPGEVVQIAAGLIYGPWVGTLIILFGCVVSSGFVFALVHRLGAPFVHAMVPEKYVDKLEAFEHSKKLNVIVFVLFLVPGLPKDVFTYIVPLTSMRMSEFLVLTNLGRLPGIFISTYAAAGLASGDYVESIVMFAILAVIAIVALVVFTKFMDRRDEKKEREAQN